MKSRNKDSTFQFSLNDADNIRLDPNLEPYGAIGDAGWYNMRAAVEYTAPGVKVVGVDAYVRRDRKSKAVITGSGVIAFSDGSTNTWNCGAGATSERIQVPSEKPPAALMFENFAAMVGNSDRFEASVAASERTQEWLDAIWTQATKNERS